MRMKRLFFALMLIAAGFSLAAEDLRPVNAIVIRHDVSFDMTNDFRFVLIFIDIWLN